MQKTDHMQGMHPKPKASVLVQLLEFLIDDVLQPLKVKAVGFQLDQGVDCFKSYLMHAVFEPQLQKWLYVLFEFVFAQERCHFWAKFDD